MYKINLINSDQRYLYEASIFYGERYGIASSRLRDSKLW